MPGSPYLMVDLRSAYGTERGRRNGKPEQRTYVSPSWALYLEDAFNRRFCSV